MLSISNTSTAVTDHQSEETKKKAFSFSILDILSKQQTPLADTGKKNIDTKSKDSRIEEEYENKNFEDDENVLGYESDNNSILSDEYDDQDLGEMNMNENELNNDDYSNENGDENEDENSNDGIFFKSKCIN